MLILDLHVVEKGRAFCARDSSEEALGLRVPGKREPGFLGELDYFGSVVGGGAADVGAEQPDES